MLAVNYFYWRDILVRPIFSWYLQGRDLRIVFYDIDRKLRIEDPAVPLIAWVKDVDDDRCWQPTWLLQISKFVLCTLGRTQIRPWKTMFNESANFFRSCFVVVALGIEITLTCNTRGGRSTVNSRKLSQ